MVDWKTYKNKNVLAMTGWKTYTTMCFERGWLENLHKIVFWTWLVGEPPKSYDLDMAAWKTKMMFYNTFFCIKIKYSFFPYNMIYIMKN